MQRCLSAGTFKRGTHIQLARNGKTYITATLTPPDVETGVPDGAQKDGHAGQGQWDVVRDINWPLRVVTRTPLRAGVHYSYLLLLAGSMLLYHLFHGGMFKPTASKRKLVPTGYQNWYLQTHHDHRRHSRGAEALLFRGHGDNRGAAHMGQRSC